MTSENIKDAWSQTIDQAHKMTDSIAANRPADTETIVDCWFLGARDGDGQQDFEVFPALDDGANPMAPDPACIRVRIVPAQIEKTDIFHYVYAVLHDPLYREKYSQNLNREFPRIPMYGDNAQVFWFWAQLGKELMSLHIGYENVEPWPLVRTDAAKTNKPTKPLLKLDKARCCIEVDTVTTLACVPPDAWEYRLGNRSAIEWVLDQYKESTPRDETIREKFDTYRLKDHKEKVIDLLQRVTRVSIETQEITKLMLTQDGVRGVTTEPQETANAAV